MAILRTLSFLILPQCFLFAAWLDVREATAEPLRVGLIAPLTGPLQQHGEAMVASLKLGLENAHCNDSVMLFPEDDGYDPKRTVTAARKLIDSNHVQILLGVGSGPTRAIAAMAERNEIPLLSLAGDSSVAKGNKFVIRLRKPAEDEGAEILALVGREKAERIALICSQNEFTLSVCNSIEKGAASKIVFREDLTPDTTDFRTEILKIKNVHPTHVIPILVPGKLGLFAKQTFETSLGVPFLGGVFFESSSDFQSSSGALIGAKYVMPEISAEFREAYARLSAVAPGSIAWGAIFYDVGRILCSPEASSGERMSYLRSIKKFPGAVGEISFRAVGGDQFYDYRFVEKTIPANGFSHVSD